MKKFNSLIFKKNKIKEYNISRMRKRSSKKYTSETFIKNGFNILH